MAAAPGKDGAVAPQERINIRYKTETGGVQEDVELPLRLLVLGDFTGRPDTSAAPDFKTIEERKPINIDKDNFNQVMTEQNLGVDVNVADKLSSEGGGEMSMSLKFKTLKDFEPEGIADQVPELRRLLELRSALTALKGPLGNIPSFRKKIQGILGDEGARDRLMKELGLASE